MGNGTGSKLKLVRLCQFFSSVVAKIHSVLPGSKYIAINDARYILLNFQGGKNTPTKRRLIHILMICLNMSHRHFRCWALDQNNAEKGKHSLQNYPFLKNMLVFQKSKNVMPRRIFSWLFWMHFRLKIRQNEVARTFIKYQLVCFLPRVDSLREISLPWGRRWLT